MNTDRKEPSPVQQICLSAAMVGLIGSAADTLRGVPPAAAHRAFDLVAQGLATFHWTVEAKQEAACVHLELVHADGLRVPLAKHWVSLELPAGVPNAPYSKGMQ